MAKQIKTKRLVLDLVALTDIGDSQTTEIMLMPWGNVKCANGDFVVDDESATLIIAKFGAGKKPIPIDYEHTTEGGKYATASGAAPAAGWITEIHAKKGEGIFALVKWNDAAREMIREDEYRYLSPVLSVRREDKKAVAVFSAALTNTPAIVDMERLAASENERNETMDLKELRAALAAAGIVLADDADDVVVLSATKLFIESVAKKKDDPNPLLAVAAKLGLDKSATCDVIVAKVAELQTNVPAAEYKVVTSRLEALETAVKDREGQELVAHAIETAKLNPNHEASMTHARKWAKADPVAFKAWSDSAQELYSIKRVVTSSKELDKGDDRASVIAASSKEYTDNRDKLRGIEPWAFVDVELAGKAMEKLSADERKVLKV